jgi:archaellum component FlaC
LIAFDHFQPTLQSRGNIPKISLKLAKQPEFREKIKNLLNHEPSGRLVIPTLQDALNKIEQLEKRISSLEDQLKNALRDKSD